MRYVSFALAGLILAAAAIYGRPLSAAGDSRPPSVDALLARLGYTDQDKKALLSGKVISTDVKRTRDDQLIAAVAIVLPVPIADLAEGPKQGRNIERDPDVLAFGALSEGAGAEALGKIAYTASEMDEVKRLLKVKPSDTFNLSSEEIASLRTRLGKLDGKDPAATEVASKAYREVLAGRLGAYLAKGVDGITPYDRGGKKISPAKELKAVYKQAEPFLSEHFPAFKTALSEFPKGRSPDISSKLYWVKREVEGRPAFILAHQMVEAGDGYVLMSHRQFFVGHTYDSLQVVALALPVEGGSAVFYVNSAFTDKVTGFFSGVAHSVGQGRIKEDLTKYFESVRARTN
jgi:hypothetical protein